MLRLSIMAYESVYVLYYAKGTRSVGREEVREVERKSKRKVEEGEKLVIAVCSSSLEHPAFVEVQVVFVAKWASPLIEASSKAVSGRWRVRTAGGSRIDKIYT